jgi:diphthamide synthase (EF-2-diphthine--ammonia ligase)
VYNSDKQYDVGADSIHFHTVLHDSYESLARSLNFTTETGPTEVGREEIKRLRGELDPKLAEFNRIVADDVAAYDRTAAAEGAPTVWGGDPVKIEPPGI